MPSALPTTPAPVVIAIDPHKASWTAVAAGNRLQPLATIRVGVSRDGLVRAFAALLKPGPGNETGLTDWTVAARASDLPHLHAFTRGLDLDKQAVTAESATEPFVGQTRRRAGPRPGRRSFATSSVAGTWSIWRRAMSTRWPWGSPCRGGGCWLLTAGRGHLGARSTAE